MFGSNGLSWRDESNFRNLIIVCHEIAVVGSPNLPKAF